MEVDNPVRTEFKWKVAETSGRDAAVGAWPPVLLFSHLLFLCSASFHQPRPSASLQNLSNAGVFILLFNYIISLYTALGVMLSLFLNLLRISARNFETFQQVKFKVLLLKRIIHFFYWIQALV